MTKEELFKNYLKDPLLFEKRYITNERAENLKFSDPTGSKLLDIIKIAITGNVGQESEGVISRKINSFLNTK